MTLPKFKELAGIVQKTIHDLDALIQEKRKNGERDDQTEITLLTMRERLQPYEEKLLECHKITTPKPAQTAKLENPELIELGRAVDELVNYYRSGSTSNNGVSHREQDIIGKALRAFYGSQIIDEINEYSKNINN